MTKKIFRSICLVAIAVFTASLTLIMGILYSYFSGLQSAQLKAQTGLIANAVEDGGLRYLEELEGENLRITWIEADGEVKFDNKTSREEMENHLEREEIREALQNGCGSSARYSTTLTERRFYEAVRLADGSILRLSVSQLTWWSLLLGMLRPILIVAAIAVGLSLFLAHRLSRHIVKPLDALDLDDPKPGEAYEELTPILSRIRLQQQQLKLQWAALDRKKKEFNAATQNMSEGILLLNESGTILSINDAALRLLGLSRYCVGKDLLLFRNSYQIQELLRTAQNGEHCERIIPIGEENYQINASPIVSEDRLAGIALILLDITEKEKAEKMRREFTANVSHELKTPLHSISGCAELLAGNLVESEDVPRFAQQIYAEAKRMTALVDDIISLSGLDEGMESPRQDVDVYEIAGLAVRELTPVANEARVTLKLEGESAVLNGNPRLLSQIVFNLCDNAIKYNRTGGSVTVSVTEAQNAVVLSVSDTGIGIPIDQQERIFERFYRVDKSRSKEVGGTGLGLSIVKHAAKLHRAEIEVQSEPEKGTTIRVAFPK